MFLRSAKIHPFKSINEVQEVKIEESVTAFVGMNEAGKTVFLQALLKSDDASGRAIFSPVDDYPRKDLPPYLKRHKTAPEPVAGLRFQLSDEEVKILNEELPFNVATGFQFSLVNKYDNKKSLNINVSEKASIKALLSDAALTSDTKQILEKLRTIREIPEALKDRSLTEEEKAFLAKLVARISSAKLPSVVAWEIGQWLSPRVPKFLYFGEYDVLPSKMNLPDLATRVENAKTDPKHLEAHHSAILALLRMADIEVGDFTKSGGYETLKAKIEGVSISLTDRIMAFWKQNEDLEVEVRSNVSKQYSRA